MTKPKFLLGILSWCLILIGCGRQTASKLPVDNPAAKNDLNSQRKMVHVGSGSTGFYSKGNLRQLLYRVKWNSATITGIQGTRFYGVASGVSGFLYDAAGKESSEFAANQATMDRNQGILTLQGKVRFKSVAKQGTITCANATYRDAVKIIKARGNVKASGTAWNLGPMDEVWATSNLSEIATPDLFPKDNRGTKAPN